MGNYFLSCSVFIVVFYILFIVFLKREKTFVLNRFYLLLSLLFSFLLPIITFEIPEEVFSTQHSEAASLLLQTASASSNFIEDSSGIVVGTFHKNHFSQWILYGYLSITLLLLLRFGINILMLLKQTKNSQSSWNGMKWIPVKNATSAFSFFHWLFIPAGFKADSENNDVQLCHEHVHFKQLHSLDIVVVEVICCVLWFHPMVWLLRMHIKQNHEYLADAGVIKSTGIDVHEYAKSIIQSIKNQYISALSSGFNFHQSKNRIVMLQKVKSNLKLRVFKFTCMITLLFAVLFLSSFKVLPINILKDIIPRESFELISSGFENNRFNSGVENNETTLQQKQHGQETLNATAKGLTKTPFIVLIDAGHGGKDSGHNNEKDYNLSIAKKIAARSNEEVKVILTRDSDNFITLEQRVEQANRLKPNLLLSLHCNAHINESRKGPEVYFSENNKQSESSQEYGTSLLENILKMDDFEEGQLKMANFIILKDTEVPSIMLELGFLTNPHDRELLINDNSQNELAKEIFDCLMQMAVKN